MASIAASVVASMLIDDMLKDDGGVEATKLMTGEGKYKRDRIRKRERRGERKSTNMGSAIARVAARQAIKQAVRQGGRAIAKRVSKQAVKKIALRGAKKAAKGGAIVAAGYGLDTAMRKMQGGRKRRMRRKLVRKKHMKGRRSGTRSIKIARVRT